jgi:hypothetical protein
MRTALTGTVRAFFVDGLEGDVRMAVVPNDDGLLHGHVAGPDGPPIHCYTVVVKIRRRTRDAECLAVSEDDGFLPKTQFAVATIRE